MNHLTNEVSMSTYYTIIRGLKTLLNIDKDNINFFDVIKPSEYPIVQRVVNDSSAGENLDKINVISKFIYSNNCNLITISETNKNGKEL